MDRYCIPIYFDSYHHGPPKAYLRTSDKRVTFLSLQRKVSWYSPYEIVMVVSSAYYSNMTGKSGRITKVVWTPGKKNRHQNAHVQGTSQIALPTEEYLDKNSCAKGYKRKTKFVHTFLFFSSNQSLWVNTLQERKIDRTANWYLSILLVFLLLNCAPFYSISCIVGRSIVQSSNMEQAHVSAGMSYAGASLQPP